MSNLKRRIIQFTFFNQTLTAEGYRNGSKTIKILVHFLRTKISTQVQMRSIMYVTSYNSNEDY